eukprot:scaffold28657_cov69-Phaeocystis_antarctica.AAC.4
MRRPRPSPLAPRPSPPPLTPPPLTPPPHCRHRTALHRLFTASARAAGEPRRRQGRLHGNAERGELPGARLGQAAGHAGLRAGHLTLRLRLRLSLGLRLSLSLSLTPTLTLSLALALTLARPSWRAR